MKTVLGFACGMLLGAWGFCALLICAPGSGKLLDTAHEHIFGE